MIHSLWLAPLVAVLFGCAAFLIVQLSDVLCRDVRPFDDGPPGGKPPTMLLIAGAAALGGLITVQGTSLPQLLLVAILASALVGCWYCDVRVGIVPDYFTLVPLGVFFMLAVSVHDWATIESSIAVTIPFAAAAAFSRGRGMGWGDVKLVALLGAALGLQTAIVTLSVACIVAVLVAFARRRRRDPIAFAPYLVTAMALGLTFNAL
jgi:prepilin signal peptidase PulO-like enzyme (type II secretory pathway)